MINKMLKIRQQILKRKPLIHCITNPISINDCANAVLAVGAKPIMAEHPDEVCEITKNAQALAVNLGNITDARMKSIMLSGKVAMQNHIPTIIDVVGVGCSTLRYDLAEKFIKECKPSVIKGNLSEIKKLAGVDSCACGVDIGSKDALTKENYHETIKVLKNLSKETDSIIVATGKVDLIANHNEVYAVNNGAEMLSLVTGTGCMLNVLIGAYISSGEILEGCILGASMLSISGEISKVNNAPSSFRMALLDNIYLMEDRDLIKRIKLTMGEDYEF